MIGLLGCGDELKLVPSGGGYVLLTCELLHAIRPYAEKYAADEKAFFEDYGKAHAKLSELGVEWDPEPFTISPI